MGLGIYLILAGLGLFGFLAAQAGHKWEGCKKWGRDTRKFSEPLNPLNIPTRIYKKIKINTDMKHIQLFEQFVNEKGSYMPPGDLQGWRKNPFAGYDLGMENQEYRRHIAKAIKHLPGIDKYSKMTEEYGGVAVDNMNKEIIIKQYGTEDNSKQLAKILAKIDPNLDVKSIKNNFNAKPSQRYQYDVKNDIWNYTIRKVKGFGDFKESEGR